MADETYNNLEECEDAPEEAFDEDYDDEYDLEDYVLDFYVECDWLRRDDNKHLEYHRAFLLSQYNEKELISFPEFNKLFEIEGYDRINETVSFIIHMGEEVEKKTVGLKEVVEIRFKYTDEDYRVGYFRFILRKERLIGDSFKGKIVFKTETYHDDELVNKEEIEFVNPKVEEDKVIEIRDRCYNLVAVEDEGEYVLLSSPNGKDDYSYVPVLIYQPNHEIKSWVEKREKERKVEVRTYIRLVRE